MGGAVLFPSGGGAGGVDVMLSPPFWGAEMGISTGSGGSGSSTVVLVKMTSSPVSGFDLTFSSRKTRCMQKATAVTERHPKGDITVVGP